MSPLKSSHMTRILFLTVTSLLLLPAVSHAQGRLKDVRHGHGRVEAAPIMQVSERDLLPGQVQQLTLWPHYHVTLEFPYPVARVDGGDDEYFGATVVGNKLMLFAREIDPVQTTMTVILGDAHSTLIPYLVRVDTTQSLAVVVRYTDPVSKHLNDAEARIADRLASNVDERVEKLAEARIQKRLLFSNGAIQLDRQGWSGGRGSRIGLFVEKAEQMPGPGERPHLYFRYRIFNQTPAALTDARLVVRTHSKKRRWLILSRTTSQEAAILEDVRSYEHIPPGGTVLGLLSLENVVLEPGEWLSVELESPSLKRSVVLDRLLVGGR